MLVHSKSPICGIAPVFSGLATWFGPRFNDSTASKLSVSLLRRDRVVSAVHASRYNQYYLVLRLRPGPLGLQVFHLLHSENLVSKVFSRPENSTKEFTDLWSGLSLTRSISERCSSHNSLHRELFKQASSEACGEQILRFAIRQRWQPHHLQSSVC